MTPDMQVLEFLAKRRSHPAKMLGLPAPDPDQLHDLLERAARVPDHGKLEPWRFVALTTAACQRIAARIGQEADNPARDPEKVAKVRDTFAQAPLVVAVIASPKASDKIPVIEQTLSAGAVCLSLVNSALAAGWGAVWLTGWVAHDHALATELLDLAPGEWVAGFVHIGTSGATPPERPRPDVAALTRWVTA